MHNLFDCQPTEYAVSSERSTIQQYSIDTSCFPVSRDNCHCVQFTGNRKFDTVMYQKFRDTYYRHDRCKPSIWRLSERHDIQKRPSCKGCLTDTEDYYHNSLYPLGSPNEGAVINFLQQYTTVPKIAKLKCVRNMIRVCHIQYSRANKLVVPALHALSCLSRRYDELLFWIISRLYSNASRQ